MYCALAIAAVCICGFIYYCHRKNLNAVTIARSEFNALALWLQSELTKAKK